MEYDAQGYFKSPTCSGEIEKISLSPLGHLMIRIFDDVSKEYQNLSVGNCLQLFKKSSQMKNEDFDIVITSQNKRKKNKWE